MKVLNKRNLVPDSRVFVGPLAVTSNNETFIQDPSINSEVNASEFQVIYCIYFPRVLLDIDVLSRIKRDIITKCTTFIDDHTIVSHPSRKKLNNIMLRLFLFQLG